MAAILIIEDDTSVSNHIENYINSIDRNDIRILKSKDGMKALEIAKMMEINVFVIDVGLPDCNGIDLAKTIRKTYPYQPIIIESSNNAPLFKSHVHDQIENIAFLSKPYTKEKFISKIKHALNIAENMDTSHLRINQNGFSKILKICNIIYIEKIKGKKVIDIVSYNQDKQLLSQRLICRPVPKCFDRYARK